MGLFGPPNIEKLETKKDVSGLIKALDHKNESIRVQAIEALRKVNLTGAFSWILKMAKDDPSEEVKKTALNAVKYNTYKLLSLLKDTAFPQYRYYAAHALGIIGGQEFIEPLLEASKDENEFVRQHVVIALGTYIDNKVAQRLIEIATEDPHPVVQLTAASQLKEMWGKLKDENIKKAVELALKDLKT